MNDYKYGDTVLIVHDSVERAEMTVGKYGRILKPCSTRLYLVDVNRYGEAVFADFEMRMAEVGVNDE